jgi:hypothetical protein
MKEKEAKKKYNEKLISKRISSRLRMMLLQPTAATGSPPCPIAAPGSPPSPTAAPRSPPSPSRLLRRAVQKLTPRKKKKKQLQRLG